MVSVINNNMKPKATMFGKYFKHVLVLTLLAGITYSLPQVKAAMVGEEFQPAAVSVAVSSLTSKLAACPAGYTCVPETSIVRKDCPSGYVCYLNTTAPGQQNIQLTVTTDKSEYQPKEAVKIYAKASNISKDIVRMEFGGCQIAYSINEFDSAKTDVCAARTTSITLKPGESYIWRMEHTSSRYQIPAGTYKIGVRLLNAKGDMISGAALVTVKGKPTTPQPVIKVTYPQAGYVLENGGKDSGIIANITWSTSMNIGAHTLSINLMDESGNIVVKNLASNLPNTGTFAWKYDSSIPSGKYQILVYVDSAKGGYGNNALSGVFSLVTVSAPQAVTPTTSLISTDTIVFANTNANDDIGTFKIKYKVTAVGGDVYVSPYASTTGVQYVVQKAGADVSSSGIVATLTNVTDSSRTANLNYFIEEGTAEVFELTVMVPLNGTSLSAGQYRALIKGIRWDIADNIWLSNNLTTGFEELVTNYQGLN